MEIGLTGNKTKSAFDAVMAPPKVEAKAAKEVLPPTDHCSVPVNVVPGQGLHEQKGINPGEDANHVRQGECESRACICDYKVFNTRLACSSSCERPSSSTATPRTASAREPGHENWLDRHEPNRP